MTQFEKTFEKIVNAVRFDDTPSETHRRQLEEQLLEVYDKSSQEAPAAYASLFYLKRVAMAAGFVIAAGLLVWFFDGEGLSPHIYPAHAPDAQTVEHILNQENATGERRQALLAEIQQTWKLIAAEDVEGLTAVVLDPNAAESLRNWAGRYLAALGTEETLGILEKHIEVRGLADTDDPVVLTATGLRWFLENSPNTPPGETSQQHK